MLLLTKIDTKLIPRLKISKIKYIINDEDNKRKQIVNKMRPEFVSIHMS